MRTFTLPNTHWNPELDYNACCQCAYEYSGNFYDFLSQDHGGLAISFGDLPSTGHHAPSINVPCMQALVRGLSAGSGSDLAGLARELNGTLYLLGSVDLCVPWFFGRLDPVKRRLTYVNAGHEAPLLIRGDGTIARLERTGAALGLSTRAGHRQESIAIDTGDLLAVFSDAVSEHAVLDVVLSNPQAGSAELTRRVLDEVRLVAEDRTFAAIRVVGAARHPLMEDRAADLVLCAA
jgi:serine phosphatase RsbU (regulator of sigma subunit)